MEDTALAAAFGSLVGAATSLVTPYVTQQRATIRENTQWKLRERQKLYKEFIARASRLAAEAASSSVERPEQLTTLYGIMSEIRLISDDEVLAEAERCCHYIADLYRQPNLTPEQIRDAFELDGLDPLKDFSSCCRKELLAMSGAR
jgi:predicted transcriptional regulator